MSETTRRAVLTGAAGAGAAAVLAACSSNGDPGSGSGSTGGNGGSTGGTDNTGGGGTFTTKKSDVPVGGGTVISQSVVVTQPTAGTFKAFSAVCTHQGCPVNEVKDGTINCPCHGSRYSITDGSVKVAGPGLSPQTQKPLKSMTAAVNGDTITVS